MSMDFYVAVHQPDFPNTADIRRCLAAHNYPMTLMDGLPRLPEGEIEFPLVIQGQKVSLEAELTRLDAAGVYQWEVGSIPVSVDRPGGSTVEIRQIDPKAKPIPHRLADDLSKLGVANQSFRQGDYVITLHLGEKPIEIKAGFMFTAALIRCANGFGFELESGTHGAESYAKTLEDQANSVEAPEQPRP